MLAVGDNPMIVHDAQTFWLVLLCEERRRVITYIIHALKIAVVFIYSCCFDFQVCAAQILLGDSHTRSQCVMNSTLFVVAYDEL